MKKYTTEEIIGLFNKVHNGKYRYDSFVYNGMNHKSTITCPIHGDFLQDAHSHLKGQGCPKCGLLSRTLKRKDTKDSFIQKAIKKHGDKYTYENVDYKSSQEYVSVTCPVHGDFLIKPYDHIQGHGCPKCYNEKRKTLNKKDIETFRNEMYLLYVDKYNFNDIIYTNSKTKIELSCDKHGTFYRTPSELLENKHCPMCMKLDNEDKRKEKFQNNFIKVANEKHNYKYDYSKLNYVNSSTPVEIICPIHGSFFQKPSYHLSGNGCQQCAKEMITSFDEKKICDFLNENGISISKNNRHLLSNNLELDIYIPDKKIAIEYDGLYWHNERNKPNPNYHLNKTIECESQGIRLIHIFEDEWLFKGDIVKSRLKNILGLTPRRIFARKCTLKEVSYKESKAFLDENHIQGNCMSRYRYGLYYKNELVSLMTFGKLRKNLNGKTDNDGSYELLRFCNKIDTTVVGGASRLIKKFIQEVKPLEITSYADRRWSDGKLYEKLGFKLDHTSKPNYFYVIGNKRENRFNYRKDVLVKQGFDKSKSEHEIMLDRNMYRIYDCGCMVYRY